MLKKVSKESINQAYARIKGHIVNTPLISVNSINDKFNSKVFFKLESEQKTGSFRFICCRTGVGSRRLFA